jgi:phenylalanyl-tRNA synthetase beta chain
MPTVSLNRDELFKELGQTYTDEEFDDLCFRFGIELDEVTSEKELIEKEQGKASNASEEIIYKIEVPANRYDLLCMEGISRALRIFNGKEEAPLYTVTRARESITVSPTVAEVRPFVVGAVLRGITFTDSSYNSFIDLQEKLHQNICRKRALVSIGTHDLDTVKGPFTYEARKPHDISFVPLNMTESLNGEQLMQKLSVDSHLRHYVPIIRDSPVYPVVVDANGRVLSLPPIINGDHSKIKLSTTNVLIEITATDLTKAKVVLNTVVAMFSQYCSSKYSVEAVNVVDAAGHAVPYPDLSQREETAAVEYINKSIGINLPPAKMAELLKRMGLSARLIHEDKDVVVKVPPTRSDILHACDIMEDVAIAYGYNNLALTVPRTPTVARQQPLNKFSDLLRSEVAFAGFSEAFTFSLCSAKENFVMLNRKDDGSAVRISNPATQEFEVGRTSLLIGLLKSVNCNKDQPLPIKIFELSDVLVKDASVDVGARNKRNLAAVYYNTSSGFEVLHGLLDRVMLVLGVPFDKEQGYHIVPSEDSAFFPGRRADIYWHGQKVGVFGVVHPLVLKQFDLSYPCSALELFIEPFLHHKLNPSAPAPPKEAAIEVVHG